MIYKLSYTIAQMAGNLSDNQQEILADDEIQLVYALLNMERDVGKICYNVKIEKIKRPENFQKQHSNKECLKAIQHYAKILEKDLK